MPCRLHIYNLPLQALALEWEEQHMLMQAEKHYRQAEWLEEWAAWLRWEAATLEVAARQELRQVDNLIYLMAQLKEECKEAIWQAVEAATQAVEQCCHQEACHQGVRWQEVCQQEVCQQEVYQQEAL